MGHRETRTVRVFLVAEHPALLQSLALILEEEGMTVCGMAADAEAALLELPEGADLVLVGLSGGGSGGLDLLREMGLRPGSPPGLILSPDDDPISIGLAIAAGARGYVPSRRASELLADAIREVVAGRTYLPPPTGSGTPQADP